MSSFRIVDAFLASFLLSAALNDGTNDTNASNGSSNFLAAQAPPSTITANGFCSTESVCNGVFEKQGTTASGAPFYRKDTTDNYIYYDPDCNAGGSTGRWVCATQPTGPNTTRSNDLDNDLECFYHARISSNPWLPWGTQTWRAYCDGSWADVSVTLQEAPPPPPPPPPASTSLVNTVTCIDLFADAAPAFSKLLNPIASGGTLEQKAQQCYEIARTDPGCTCGQVQVFPNSSKCELSPNPGGGAPCRLCYCATKHSCSAQPLTNAWGSHIYQCMLTKHETTESDANKAIGKTMALLWTLPIFVLS